MSTFIHSTAIVDPAAEIGADVSIGPFCTVGATAKIGDRTKLISHVVVDGLTTIGSDNMIYPFVSLGLRPQDLKFKGEASRLEIGNGNQIREGVTMNPGTEGGGMITRVGNNGLFMVGAHIAHDCQIGNNVIMANNATLAGHVHVGDYVLIGGLAATHQFVRIGAHAVIGGMSAVSKDVIPFGLVKGERAYLDGLNMIGLERRGFSREDIRALRGAYRMLFAHEGTLAERLEETAAHYKGHAQVVQIIDFIRSASDRSICQPKSDED